MWNRCIFACTCVDKRTSIFGEEFYSYSHYERDGRIRLQIFGVVYVGLMIEKKFGLPMLIKYNVQFGYQNARVLGITAKGDDL
ncbi:hypothetical protein SOVF_144540 [Spinacia oleracea]|nr:hypothetical protein SOVF_144540 [Spinacia oleracea]